MSVDPIKNVEFVVDNHVFLYYWYFVIYIVSAICIFLVSHFLSRAISKFSVQGASFIFSIGNIWSVLLLLSGLVTTIGITEIVQMTENSGRSLVWSVISVIQNSFGGGQELIGGLWCFSITYIGFKYSLWSKKIVIMGLLASVLGVLSSIHCLLFLGGGFGLAQIIWFIWMAGLIKSNQFNHVS
ncbi:hypothetical protein [Vibrio sp. 99-70-13A1]|uniref:hypothetical protein n=1 Tax=Vibrio sp. 99-70-13A1 TaxID=2607601 RepID=UPI001493C0C0|nr:hypothetical protein [Vibrio sp. 99-70-13A1]